MAFTSPRLSYSLLHTICIPAAPAERSSLVLGTVQTQRKSWPQRVDSDRRQRPGRKGKEAGARCSDLPPTHGAGLREKRTDVFQRSWSNKRDRIYSKNLARHFSNASHHLLALRRAWHVPGIPTLGINVWSSAFAPVHGVLGR